MSNISKKKKVDEMFFSDPEKGRQAIERIRKSDLVHKNRSSKDGGSNTVKIIYDAERSRSTY